MGIVAKVMGKFQITLSPDDARRELEEMLVQFEVLYPLSFYSQAARSNTTV